MKVCILMGGERIILEDTSYPLYMTQLQGKMLVEHRIDYFSQLHPSDIICCHHKEDERDFYIAQILQQMADNIRCVPIQAKTGGALCTALLASPYLVNDEELLIAAVDEHCDADPIEIVEDFRKKHIDVGLVSFTSYHPAYAYVKRLKNGKITEVVTKKTVSNDALATFYYFRRADIFLESAKNVIRKETTVFDRYYLSQCVNEAMLLGYGIDLAQIPACDFHPLKNHIQLNDYFLLLKNKSELR